MDLTKHIIIGFKHWKLEGKNEDSDWVLIDEQILDSEIEIPNKLSFDLTQTNTPETLFEFSQIRLTILGNLIYEQQEEDKWSGVFGYAAINNLKLKYIGKYL